MLEVKNLKKSFGTNEVLKGIDFKVDKGEVVVILGASGSGKTTMLRCLDFLERVDQGTIVIDGDKKDMSHISRKEIKQLRMEMGYVFQNFNLFNNMTALENVMEGLVTARKLDRNEARQIAMNMLEKVDLADRADYYPQELSGGQQQRVAIARAIAPSPRLILFDEPTSALDPVLTVEVLDTIKKLAKEGITMVVVTHEMDFAREIASRVVFMADGYVVEEGSVEEVFDNPKDERTSQFIHHFKMATEE